MTIRSVQVLVSGRVQGVGYRAFVEQQAVALGLSGWVRNRRDGSVEAVLSGDAGRIAEMLAVLERGPRHAVVASVTIIAEVGPEEGPFLVAPSL